MMPSQKAKNNVVLDLDGVLADFEGAFCRKFGPAKRHFVKLELRYPMEAERIKYFVNDWKTYANLPVLQLGLDIVGYLVDNNFQIDIVSSRPSSALVGTINWLKHYQIPYVALSVNQESKIGRIKRLKPICEVDDIGHVAECLGKERIPAFLVDQPWNQEYYLPRIKSLNDFINLFKGVL